MKTYAKVSKAALVVIAAVLTSNVAFAAVPKSALVKAEPINLTMLVEDAHTNLQDSLNTVEVEKSSVKLNKTVAHYQRDAKKNKPVTLASTNKIAR